MNPRIRALREDNDFNQTEIARFLDMSQTGYSKYETGENDIPVSTLIKLSFFYDASMEYLIGTSEIRQLPKPSPDETKRYRKYRKAFEELKNSHSAK